MKQLSVTINSACACINDTANFFIAIHGYDYILL